MKHYLQSDTGAFYQSERFNKEEIRAAIIEQLAKDPNDLIEHCRDWDTPAEKRKFYGLKSIDFYECNPKTGWPSLCVMKGEKLCYKSLIDPPLPF